jgi:tetratricopeptide (TPR) repeat protein
MKNKPSFFPKLAFICALTTFMFLLSTTHKSQAARGTSFTTTEIDDSFYDKAWRSFQIGTKSERKDVMSALRAVIRKNPEEFLAHYYLGIMYSQDGSPTTALRYFKTALVGYPNSADINVRIGKLLDRKNKREEANEYYRKAIELDPNNGEALSRVGITELEKGNNQKAYELLTKARQNQPDNPDTLRALGEVLIQSRNSQAAIKILKQALLFDKEHAQTHWLLARAYEEANEAQKAADHFKLAQKHGRREPEVKELIGYDLARSLAKSGNFEAAEKEYKKQIRKSDDNGTGYYELGRLYEDYGYDDDAIRYYKKAYEDDRQYGQGIMNAAEIYMDREEYDKAEEMYKMLSRDKTFKEDARYAREDLEEIRQRQEEIRIENKLNQSYITDGEKEATLLKLLEENSKNEIALEGLWHFYEERGYYKEAIKYYRKYVRLNPVSDYLKEQTIDEMKEKYKEDNYKLWGYAYPKDRDESKASDSELSQLAEYGENDRVRETAMDLLAFRRTRKTSSFSNEGEAILEDLLYFYEDKGYRTKALKTVTRLKRYDFWSDYEADAKREQLKEDLDF